MLGGDEYPTYKHSQRENKRRLPTILVSSRKIWSLTLNIRPINLGWTFHSLDIRQFLLQDLGLDRSDFPSPYH